MAKKSAKKKPLSKRAKARQIRQRRDPFGRFAQEVQRYLDSIGWTALIVGPVGIAAGGRSFKYELMVEFTGAKRKERAK